MTPNGMILHNYREINLGLPRPVTVHRNSYLLRITPSHPVYQPLWPSPMRMTGLGSCFGITRLTTVFLKTTERKVTDAAEVVERWKSITTLGLETARTGS